MADKYSLSAQTRKTDKDAKRQLMAQNRVLGVVYGHNFDSAPLSIDASDMLRTYRKAGTAGLIDLDIDGKKSQVIIKDVVLHPVKDSIMHVDFYAVNPKEKTTVKVPFNFTGEAPAEKNFGGIFTVAHEYVEIRCLPADIPHDIEIDVSGLENLGDGLVLEQLSLDEKYEVMDIQPDMLICSVIGRKEEVEEEPEEGGEEGEEGTEETTEEGSKEESSEEKNEE